MGANERTIGNSSQLQNQSSLLNVKSKARQQLDVLHELIDNKLIRQMEISVIGSLVQVTKSEVVITETDGVSGIDNQGLQSSYKVGAPLLDGTYHVFEDSYLDLDTGGTSGSFASSLTEPPSILSGENVYLGIQATTDGEFDVVWSVVSGTSDVNTISWGDEDLKLGFVSLIADQNGLGWGNFFEPSNTDVTNLPLGGGAGSGGDNSFKIKSILNTKATIAKGSLRLSNGDTLITGSGPSSADTNVELQIDLDTILMGSPASSTTYYLYIDRTTLDEAVNLSDNGRKVVLVPGESKFKLLTTSPEETDAYRFVSIGYIRTSSGGDWTGGDASFGSAPAKLKDLVNDALLVPETKSITVTQSITGTEFEHGLTGKPQIIQCWYYDGTDLLPEAKENVIQNVNDNIVEIVSNHLSFGSGEYLITELVYYAGSGNQSLMNMSRYETPWLTDDTLSGATHGLTDGESIAGLSLTEYDSSEQKYYPRDVSEVVSSWDDNSLHFNWDAITPSSTNRFKVRSGGSPLPASIPLYVGGYTKLVGFGPGSYPTLLSALADAVPGDSILVNKNQTFTSTLTLSVDDIKVTFMPGVICEFTAGTKGMSITGRRIVVENPHIKCSVNGTMLSALEVQLHDSYVARAVVEANHSGLTITDAYAIFGGARRNYINGVLYITLGTITNKITDNGIDSDYSIRG